MTIFDMSGVLFNRRRLLNANLPPEVSLILSLCLLSLVCFSLVCSFVMSYALRLPWCSSRDVGFVILRNAISTASASRVEQVGVVSAWLRVRPVHWAALNAPLMELSHRPGRPVRLRGWRPGLALRNALLSKAFLALGRPGGGGGGAGIASRVPMSTGAASRLVCHRDGSVLCDGHGGLRCIVFRVRHWLDGASVRELHSVGVVSGLSLSGLRF